MVAAIFGLIRIVNVGQYSTGPPALRTYGNIPVYFVYASSFTIFLLSTLYKVKIVIKRFSSNISHSL